ncbi:LysR substrate-binding domain-containing protein [uncultured Hoeflea sp.]|uniref:LysR substrate-binding domain-containing protein n=1 Tax=uncultured Hoeflea sp. TaxID=538666 RepID=UPI002603B392|nr:LysR substrate-binding domain-containing protein [uncultured Hoeflea sp.]
MKELNRVHLNGLRAIEAVARLGGLKAAAEELGVTAGAISQQVQKTEAQIGKTLFVRDPKGLRPTQLAQSVMPHLTAGFGELSTGLKKCAGTGDRALVVSVAPVFAAKWLVWRLKAFNDAWPDIRIRVDATVCLVDMADSDVDVCIRVGHGPYPGVKAAKLLKQRVFPVCSPAIADQLAKGLPLSRVPIIRDQFTVFDWDVWLEPMGLRDTRLKPGPVFSDASLCLDSAVAGQGLFLAWETLAHDGLEAGRLVAPFKGRVETGAAYWIIEPLNTSKARESRAFITWLRQQMGRSFALEPAD